NGRRSLAVPVPPGRLLAVPVDILSLRGDPGCSRPVQVERGEHGQNPERGRWVSVAVASRTNVNPGIPSSRCAPRERQPRKGEGTAPVGRARKGFGGTGTKVRASRQRFCAVTSSRISSW